MSLSVASQSLKTVAVVIPLSLRAEITPDEKISLLHLHAHLDSYEKVLIAPQSLAIRWPGFRTIDTPDEFFGSGPAHGRLMTQPEFYDQFTNYDYILTYHLDALVFSDQLREWCDAGYDYIGAPLKDDDGRLTLVGNGGFALRRVAAFQKLLRSRRRCLAHPLQAWRKTVRHTGFAGHMVRLPWHILKCFGIANDMRHELRVAQRTGFFYEDLFIATRALHYDPDFLIAPLDQAFRFAFDEFPRQCFERNGRRMPFGCHAWPKYDRAFWEPYLLGAPIGNETHAS
jgi:hypothetical protein